MNPSMIGMIYFIPSHFICITFVVVKVKVHTHWYNRKFSFLKRFSLRKNYWRVCSMCPKSVFVNHNWSQFPCREFLYSKFKLASLLNRDKQNKLKFAFFFAAHWLYWNVLSSWKNIISLDFKLSFFFTSV